MTIPPITARIDLRSDTVTRPTHAMRAAMMNAEVGDDVLDGDPTVLALQTRVAAMLGADEALFFPTGTMANQAALWLHGIRGTEVLLDSEAHIIHWEVAGAAGIVGLQVRPVPAADGGVMRAADLSRSIRPRSKHAPRASLVCVENTHNGAGGRVTPLDDLRAIVGVAHEHGLPVHMDGARLWNAAAATGASLASFGGAVDTAMVSFSKGLGAPVGAMLVGTSAAMRDAWEVRKRLGGGMRQSGILAAAVLYALDHHLGRLPEDHRHARLLADRLSTLDGVRVVSPDTNIVMVDLPPHLDSATVVQAALTEGVLVTPWSPTRIRAVTHLDVTREAVERAAEVLTGVLGGH